jgi:hypothetical protein
MVGQCIYDNPTTMSREWWMDGELIMSLDSMLFVCDVNFPKNIAPWLIEMEWEGGRIVGDKEAIIKREVD